MNKRCLLDLNIVLDIVNKRPRYNESLKEISKYDKHYITVNSYLNLFYVLRRTNRDKEEILEQTKFLEVVDSTKESFLYAVIIAKSADDVEDCSEIIIARDIDLDFITADKAVYTNYSKYYSNIILVK